MSSSPEVIKTGVLIKKSRNRGAIRILDNWQERKINLMKGSVTYGPVDGPTKDSIPINASTIVESTDLAKDMGKSFKIRTGDDELVLCCPDEFIRDEWIKAVTSTAHDAATPAPAPAPEPAADTEAERLKAEAAAKAAEEAEAIKRKSVTLLGNYERELAAFNKAQENKRKTEAELQLPVACKKKLSTETSFNDRFIWVNPTTKEFHWSKNAEDTSKSKCINIMTHVKAVTYNTMLDQVDPNLTIELSENANELPDTVFSTNMFKSARPSSIDIVMTNASQCSAMVTYINEIKNPPPAPVPPAKPELPSMPNMSGLSMGGMGMGMAKAAANAAGVPTSASSAAHMMGAPTSVGGAVRSVL